MVSGQAGLGERRTREPAWPGSVVCTTICDIIRTSLLRGNPFHRTGLSLPLQNAYPKGKGGTDREDVPKATCVTRNTRIRPLYRLGVFGLRTRTILAPPPPFSRGLVGLGHVGAPRLFFAAGDPPGGRYPVLCV